MKRWWFVGLMVVFVILRLVRIGERVNFSMDQGRDAIRALEIWQNREITLLGPTASPKVAGRNFFNGPLPYYSMVAVLAVAGWDPVAAAGVLVILNLAAMVGLALIIKITVGEVAAWMGMWWWTFWPITIEYSSFLWNPNFLLILMPVYLGLLVKKRWWWSGVMAGVCLQYHLQVVTVIGATVAWLIWQKIGVKKLMQWGAGILVGYSPLLVFDLRNNFYNLRTMAEWLMNGGEDKFGLSSYYFLAWVPIVILIMVRIMVKYRLLAIGGLIVLGLTTIGSVIGQKQAYGMPENWNYNDLVAAEEIILANNKGMDFNVANLISGDTRFYSLRYLLIRDGLKPRGVEDYGDQKQLWIISDKGPEGVLDYPVWEVESMKKKEVAGRWEINDKVWLYLVTD